MADLKILHVLEANVGGARGHVHQILHGLDPERFELHLACSVERDMAAPQDAAELSASGIRVHTIPMQRQPGFRSDRKSVRALEALMRRERFDLVHTHASKGGFLGRLAGRRAGVRAVVHTPHTFAFERRDTWLGWFYRMLERRAARWTDRMVLVAESQRDTARRVCPDGKLVVIENAVEPPPSPSVLRPIARQLLGIPNGALAVAYVGRVTPQKDIQTFLSMVERLAGGRSDARFFLVGGADNGRYVRSLRPRFGKGAWRTLFRPVAQEEDAFWSPDVPVRLLAHRDDADELVTAFDAVVLPSLYEGLPYSLLEAMACGVPVVASDVTGNRDAIRDGENGLLAPPGRVGGFVDGVTRLLDDGDLRARMGAEARRTVQERFTRERFLRETAELYGELLGG
ncbi:glycosyltransferase family 4 protein [bacterium]|nr:glycosyltransferase family 4 protein [bacterium]